MKGNVNLYARQYLKKEHPLFIFLLLFIAVVIPACSGGNDFNFWVRLDLILKNSYFHVFLFLALCLNSFFNAESFLQKYEILIRFRKYENILKVLCKKIILSSLFLLFISLILAVSGAWLFSFGNRNLVLHDSYDILLPVYILFFILRMAILMPLLNIILIVLGVRFKKVGIIGFALLNTLLFLIPIPDDSYIVHFYDLFLLPQAYFTDVYYSSFLLEVVCSIIEIFIWILIYRILYYFFIKNAKEISIE